MFKRFLKPFIYRYIITCIVIFAFCGPTKALSEKEHKSNIFYPINSVALKFAKKKGEDMLVPKKMETATFALG